jgi:hypothetical protein
MLPTKSNTAEKGCSPVSSNCVVWQGPDLSCINLCNGDTISDVTYKVATQLCTIQTELNLSSLDLSCLVNFCAAVNPAPTDKTLSAVLEFIIDKICCLNGIVENIDLSTTYVEPTLTLPSCLQYTDQTTNQLITVLQHNQYTLRLANQFCSLKTTVDGHTSQISSLSTRVTALENEPDPAIPVVTPEYILTPGVSTPVTAVVDELESQFGQLKQAIGTASAVVSAISNQCTGLGSSNALSTAGTMSQITGWVQTVSTLSDSYKNLWLTVCDLRSAIALIKDTLDLQDCTDFLLDFEFIAINNRYDVTLDFNPFTMIPANYVQCTVNGAIIKITDGVKTLTYTNENIVTAASAALPITIAGVSDGTTAKLNNAATYTVTVELCITKDGKTCQRIVSKTSVITCPVVTSINATLI